MATIPDIYEALAAAIPASVLNVRAFEDPAPVYPALILGLPASYTPHPELGGGFDLAIPVRLLVEYDDPASAFAEALEFMSPTGPRSIQAALYEDTELGGVIDDLTIGGWSEFGFVTSTGEGAVRLLTATATVEIMA